MVHDLENDLRRSIRGDVRFDPVAKKVYSVDASIFEIEPIGIVLPIDKQDLLIAIKIAHSHNVPIIARGAATGIAGGCIGKGLILDLSKYLNQIIEINFDKEYAICQPGVIQDTLNQALSAKGYRLGPDTSTGNRATLGGMLANNAAGARSLRYGKMVDHVEAVEIALANGETLTLQSIDGAELEQKCLLQNAEGNLYSEVIRIRKQYKTEIEAHFPKIPRRVSGYNLDELIKSEFPSGLLNLSKLIAGSEGTLGIATEIKVKIVAKPKTTGLCIVHFHEVLEGMDKLPFILSFSPLSAEMIDRYILQAGSTSPSMKNNLSWLQGDPAAVFVIEFDGDSSQSVLSKLETFEKSMRDHQIGYACTQILDTYQMENVWKIRKAGLGLLLSRRTYSRAIAFIEDFSVAPEKLASFMRQFQLCLKKFGKEAAIYGHVGSGCMHVRPFVDMRQNEEIHIMHQMMLDVAALLLEHGGALSGEHGDGLVRSWLNKLIFGEVLYQAFIEVKAAFDPENRLNPGKIVHATDFLEHIDKLRINPLTKQQKISTFLDFSKDGGFALAVDMCNGNGLCRKKEGIMCPSFQASGDEFHSTRARAQALRSIINGRLPLKDFTSQGMYDVLDLCLECKGCKTECPSQVDMAKMKSEFLYHYGKKHGYSLRSYLFANIGNLNALSMPFGGLLNWIGSTRFAHFILEQMGITSKRQMPQLAKESFSKWFSKNKQSRETNQKVVLYNDTYTEFYHPEIGIAAVKILYGLGYDVIVPPWYCCGRPHISKGMLPRAKKLANKLIEILHPFAIKGIPIIGLEPSCLFTLQADMLDLVGNTHQRASDVAKNCIMLDQFLEKLLIQDPLIFNKHNSNARQHPEEILVHTHCYQKALTSSRSTLNILKSFSDCTVSEIATGCCGMAGSFGYEAEHYDFSLKIGELVLFPTIRKAAAKTTIIANGMSCRSQITQGTNRKVLHLAEFLIDRL